MGKLMSVVLIVGFLFVDFLFFHDILKPGEVVTLPQYVTGILSILVIAMSIKSLLAQPKRTQSH